MAEDVSLGDIVSAFRLELSDGLAKMDTLGRTLAQFEGEAKAHLQDVGDAGDREGSRLAQGISNGLSNAGRSLATFVVGLIGVGGILEGLRRLGDAFITTNAQVDTFVNRLASFTTGLGQARQEEQRLEDFATKMGANVGDLVDAYVLLKQRGIDPSNKSLEALGDAAAATGMSVAEVARVMAQATLDMGRGLLNFGVKMTETAGQAKFQWVDAMGQIKNTTVSATDAMIQSTLLAIWSDKYAGRMTEAARSWQGLWTSIKNSFDSLLENIGSAGAWTELKAQVAGILGEFQSLKGQDLTTWAKSTSDLIGALAKALGALGSTLIEIPLAFSMTIDAIAIGLNNFVINIEKAYLGILTVGKTLASVLPGSAKNVELLDKDIASLKDSIFYMDVAGKNLSKDMVDNALTLHRMQAAGEEAASGYRAAAAGAQEMGPQMDATTAQINRLNAAFDAEGQTLLATYGVFNQVKLNEEMAKIVKAADDLHEHGVPANEILAALGPNVTKLAKTAADFGPSFTLPDDFRRLAEGVGAGKVGMEDFVRYMDDQAWKALKTGADDTVVHITKAGGDIAEALRGGFDKGIGDAITAGKAKYQQFVTEVGQEHIVINVDINKADLIATLMSLGYTPAGMDNTAGRIRPS